MTTPFPFVAGQVLTAAQLNDIQNLPISDKTASYTLVVADVYKRTIMNNASSTTITVNNSIFTVGDVIQVANKGAGTCTITAGAGVTINTGGSLALAQYGGGYLLALSASTFTFFNLGGGNAYGTATGGIGAPTAVTISGVNYQYLTFNSTGTLTITKAGFFDYLIIGGGSGTSYYASTRRPSGGGGCGAVVCNSIYLSANQTITIGAGGSFTAFGTRSTGSNTTIGASSPFNPLAVGSRVFTATEDGAVTQLQIAGGLGGSAGGTATAYDFGLGFNGGNSFASSDYAGGGGGGFTAAGAAATGGSIGGTGGAGFDISAFIGGSASYRATGGGGGAATTPGTGGSSNASSNSGVTTAAAANATANSGSGGGGGNANPLTSGNGGSGVCFIRYKV
jgi:hypothetical protein